MRLGGFYYAQNIDELEPLCEKLDEHGLSAIMAPMNLDEDQSYAFGRKAKDLGLVIGEAGMWENLLTDDKDLQNKRIESVRMMLRKAEIMGCNSIVSLVGTKDPSQYTLVPHPYLYTEECKNEFREIVLRILDGLQIKNTKYVIEPWHNTFFYQPEEILKFIESVNHPNFGLHLDQMNMVSQENFFNTTELINKTFDLLSDKVGSVHLKDIKCDGRHLFLKWDEVFIGDGVMDYNTLLKRLSKLPPDTTCFCEHLDYEADYIVNFQRLHNLAKTNGVKFLNRSE
jgi:sugar phosphate isomerase/epimerase